MARVLIVDDDHDIRASVRELLEAEGHEVYEAPDGLEALRFLRRDGRGMVVLLDLVMPLLDGMGVLQAVAKDQTLAQSNAYVLFTVSPQRVPPADLLEQLGVTVVAKPFDLDTLLDVVEQSARQLDGPQPST
jgi:CheY-like chemotaxis protein